MATSQQCLIGDFAFDQTYQSLYPQSLVVDVYGNVPFSDDAVVVSTESHTFVYNRLTNTYYQINDFDGMTNRLYNDIQYISNISSLNVKVYKIDLMFIR